MTNLPVTIPATGLRRTVIRWTSTPLPGGCRWCGVPPFGHGTDRWAASKGWHKFTAPTEEQVAARQAARQMTPEPVKERTRCDAMTHNSVGSERFCEIEDPDHREDHGDGDGYTWPVEDCEREAA
ncbi:hypothetical protein ACFV27_00675 [Streptomyces antimycoticus]|uniref:hypothetical protein n=1 Tax=Streptomyces antimycoticus TaxID=68175 RepID=UPI0036775F42